MEFNGKINTVMIDLYRLFFFEIINVITLIENKC